MLRSWNVRLRRNVDTAVSLQQTLVSGSQEGEPVQIVLVVNFDALGKTGIRVTRDDQADQHAIYIHLIHVRRCATPHATAIGELRIDGSVERNDVTGKAV